LLNQFLTRDYGVAVRVPTAFHLESNMYGCCKCFQCNSISGLINVLPFICFDLTLFGSFSLKWEVELICIFLLGSYYYRLRNRAARGVALSTEWPPRVGDSGCCTCRCIPLVHWGYWGYFGRDDSVLIATWELHCLWDGPEMLVPLYTHRNRERLGGGGWN
jgi:hypothetical protein